jgi:hypothetical protein
MEFDSAGLAHSPEFELPDHSPQYPTDLLSLIEEKSEGLHRIVIQKFVRRGKYSQVCTITCQENPGRKTKPSATPEQISEYCMLAMQYDIDKTDEYGKYKCTLYGGPSQGRWERSKHVDLSDGDGEARSVSIMSEGDMLEQMQSYIGECHQTQIAMLESLHSIVRPLMAENKEMMKIISEAAKVRGEVEMTRLRHDLEIRMHNDDIKQKEAEEEHKMERWRELLGVVKETGAFEAIMKAVISKFKDKSDEKKERKSKLNSPSDDEGIPRKKKKKKKTSTANGEPQKKKKKRTIDADSAKKRNKSNNRKPSSPEPVETEDDEMTQEQLKEILYEEGLNRMATNPLVLAAEALKMSVDEKKQWSEIEEILSEEQFELFEEILAANSDKKIEKRIKKLYKMKGIRNLMKLQDQLDETQEKFVEVLMGSIIS